MKREKFPELIKTLTFKAHALTPDNRLFVQSILESDAILRQYEREKAAALEPAAPVISIPAQQQIPIYINPGEVA